MGKICEKIVFFNLQIVIIFTIQYGKISRITWRGKANKFNIENGVVN